MTMPISSEKQFELNFKCICRDINTFQFKKIPFHFNGLRKAMRQNLRETLNGLSK